jgi:long-chain acyl-CoA synthetase
MLPTVPLDETTARSVCCRSTTRYGASVLHTHVSVGASLVLENSLAFPQRVWPLAAAERVTGLPGVPSTFALLLRRGRLSTFDLSRAVRDSRRGGACPGAGGRLAGPPCPGARLTVMYGQTEATARLTCLPPSASPRSAAPAVGRFRASS